MRIASVSILKSNNLHRTHGKKGQPLSLLDISPGYLPKLFKHIEHIGEIDAAYSRQLGIKVYLCEKLKPDALEFMNEKIASVKRAIE